MERMFEGSASVICRGVWGETRPVSGTMAMDGPSISLKKMYPQAISAIRMSRLRIVEKKFFLRMETPFSYKRECCTFQGSFQGIAPRFDGI